MLLQVLKKVMEHEIAETFFNDPVDPDALGIPEYRDIIKAGCPDMITHHISCT